MLLPIALIGEIDEPRSVFREECAILLTRVRDFLIEPIGQLSGGLDPIAAHLRLVANSLLWGTVGVFIMLAAWRSPVEPRDR